MKSICFRFVTLLTVPVFLCCFSSGLVMAVQDGPLDEIERALKNDSAEEALQLSESLAAFSPLDAEAQALYGLALLRSGRYKDAESALLAALGLDEQCVEAHLGMGRLAAGMNRHERAVMHFREAVKSGRFRGEALRDFGGLLADSGDFSAALQVAEAAPSLLDYLGDEAVSFIAIWPMNPAFRFRRLFRKQPSIWCPAAMISTPSSCCPSTARRAGHSVSTWLTPGTWS